MQGVFFSKSDILKEDYQKAFKKLTFFLSDRMSSVRHSYVLVCYPYVARMYLHVIHMSLVCIRMSSVCHSADEIHETEQPLYAKTNNNSAKRPFPPYD